MYYKYIQACLCKLIGAVSFASTVHTTVQILYTVLYEYCTLYCTNTVHCTVQILYTVLYRYCIVCAVQILYSICTLLCRYCTVVCRYCTLYINGAVFTNDQLSHVASIAIYYVIYNTITFASYFTKK